MNEMKLKGMEKLLAAPRTGYLKNQPEICNHIFGVYDPNLAVIRNQEEMNEVLQYDAEIVDERNERLRKLSSEMFEKYRSEYEKADSLIRDSICESFAPDLDEFTIEIDHNGGKFPDFHRVVESSNCFAGYGEGSKKDHVLNYVITGLGNDVDADHVKNILDSRAQQILAAYQKTDSTLTDLVVDIHRTLV